MLFLELVQEPLHKLPVDVGASQCAVTMRIAFGGVAISDGIAASEDSRGSQSMPIWSFIHGQGPPPWAMA